MEETNNPDSTNKMKSAGIGAHIPVTEEKDEGGCLLKPLSSISYKQKVCHIISELRETAELREKAKKP